MGRQYAPSRRKAPAGGFVAITTNLPRETWQRLMAAVEEEERSLSHLACAAIEEWLRQRQERKP